MVDTNPDPNFAPATPQPSGGPPCALVVLCVECGQDTVLLLPIDHRSLAYHLAHSGWHISVLREPEPGPGSGTVAPMVFGPLCAACAQTVYPPEVFAAAEQRRQQLVQEAAREAAQAAQAQGSR